MTGFYLYCVRHAVGGDHPITAPAIDGDGHVTCVPFRRLEAVVSEVPLDTFGSEEIQRRAQEDVGWIKQKAVAHEAVIEQALPDGDDPPGLVPMQFGIVCEGRDRLEHLLEEKYSVLLRAADELRGKREWSAKAYLTDEAALDRLIEQLDPQLQEQCREAAAMPEGAAFFVEQDIEETRSHQREQQIARAAQAAYERLAGRAEKARRARLLPQELTGRSDRMVLNVACLVRANQVDAFTQEADEMNADLRGKGFALEYSGPWPAYSFTSF
ncbi:MAG: GvpL/GvpF family gas vesicle protein [Planctomycetota bacterium]